MPEDIVSVRKAVMFIVAACQRLGKAWRERSEQHQTRYRLVNRAKEFGL